MGSCFVRSVNKRLRLLSDASTRQVCWKAALWPTGLTSCPLAWPRDHEAVRFGHLALCRASLRICLLPRARGRAAVVDADADRLRGALLQIFEAGPERIYRRSRKGVWRRS